MSRPYEHRVAVRYLEVDRQGVVFNAWYLAYFDDALTGFLDHMAEPGMEPAREGLFGPVVAVPTDAPLLERVLGLAGRDPGWRS